MNLPPLPEPHDSVPLIGGDGKEIARKDRYTADKMSENGEVMQEKALQYVALFGQLQEAQEAIAKKDAALDACVGAMNSCDTKVKEIWSERRGWHDIEMQEFDKSAIDAAIEQAKEARG